MARDKFRFAMMRQYSASLRMLIRRDNAKYSSARVRKYGASCTLQLRVFEIFDLGEQDAAQLPL